MPTDLSSSSTESYDATVLAPAGGDPRTSASARNPMQSLTDRIRWVWARVQEAVGSFLPLGSLFPIALSVSGSTFTLAGHGLANNDPVQLWAPGGATLPAPLAVQTTYYANAVTSNTFQLSGFSGGSSISLTTAGAGNFFAAKMTALTFVQQLMNLTAATLLVVGYTGASFTIVAGALQTFLQTLANNAANLAATLNTFVGNVTVGGTLGVTGQVTTTGNALVGGVLTATGGLVSDLGLTVVNGASFGTGVTMQTLTVGTGGAAIGGLTQAATLEVVTGLERTTTYVNMGSTTIYSNTIAAPVPRVIYNAWTAGASGVASIFLPTPTGGLTAVGLEMEFLLISSASGQVFNLKQPTGAGGATFATFTEGNTSKFGARIAAFWNGTIWEPRAGGIFNANGSGSLILTYS